MRKTRYDYSKLRDEFDTEKLTVCFRTPSRKKGRRGTWICQRVKYSPDYDTNDEYIALSVARCMKGRTEPGSHYSPNAEIAVVPTGNRSVEVFQPDHRMSVFSHYVSKKQWKRVSKRFVGGSRHRWINEICDAHTESRGSRAMSPRRRRKRR